MLAPVNTTRALIRRWKSSTHTESFLNYDKKWLMRLHISSALT